MRQPIYLIPSLPIFSHFTSILRYTATARAESIPEAAIRPRAVIDARINVQWPAARAVQPEPAGAQLIERNVDTKLEERQDYYAFSGAIYIVGAGGESLSGLNAASPAYCPNNAPQSCGNIQVWNWCCPSGNTCAWADWAQTYVGCCPAGYSCAQGSINHNAVQTVTVYVTTTQWGYGGGGGGPPTHVVVQGGGQQQQTTTVNQQGGGGVVIVGTTTAPVTYNGFCTTIFAQNVDQPTQAAVPCGVALVVSEGSKRNVWHVLGLMGALWSMLFIMMLSARLLR